MTDSIETLHAENARLKGQLDKPVEPSDVALADTAAADKWLQTIEHIPHPKGYPCGHCSAWRAVQARFAFLRRDLLKGNQQGRKNAPYVEPLRAVVETFVASVERYYTPKGRAPELHSCLMCDPLNPWNESDTDASGPTREQFTHWPHCKIGRLKAAAASDNPAFRKTAEPAE